MSLLSRMWTTGILTLLLVACGKPPEFQMYESKLECTDYECALFFDIENLTETELVLEFEITLTQNYIFDPDRSGMVEVGHKSGQYSLPPRQKVTFIEPVSVSEKANGSKLVVNIADGA